ncbi:conserved hypothetical protein [Pediculus humanus corporis]|uniref:BZIP domain-containing protein n=1 Tax=Pediculus humanus subsp. corporis TaxID=121224 RepID=E0VLD0_PEDHC|nr:uncharacterized protein Phum_PHUM286720 [Pediculus humanus corporis]EEB14186.1 conserved hypothetical protein [Pediculus humanus corporis]
MYSSGAVQYGGGNRIPEMTKPPEDDFVLDLSVRTQIDGGNGCNGETTTIYGDGKPTRPFKAYPKNFLGLGTTGGMIDDSDIRYMEFRRQFLSQLHATIGGTAGNKNMKRPVQSVSPNQYPSSSSGDGKDQAYWERRRKNNEAAKKSRDARRAKEDEIAIRAAFLERENLQLRLELASLKNEIERLRCVLYANN